jgi:CubicO group peptidase (beta-lactamase class C family)
VDKVARLGRLAAALCAAACLLAGCAIRTPHPARSLADPEIQRVMRREQVQGLALATIENGKVGRVRVFGTRNAALGLPMTDDTVLPAGSLTKAAFAYLLLQLADEGKLDLDAPLARLLPQPLPAYRDRPFDYADLVEEPRWRALTPRILLMHAGGFAEHRWYEPDERLRIHFDPGTRYAYSSEGYLLLQLVIEQGLGLDIEREMNKRVFERLGMRKTSLRWRTGFAATEALEYGFDGSARTLERHFRVRMGASMYTTPADQARLWAGIVRGEGLSAGMRAAMTAGSLPVASAHEFPALDGAQAQWPQGLAAGLGVMVFRDRDGPAFFKGDHDEFSANLALCRDQGQRCVLLMSNDVRAERLFPELAPLALNGTEMPWAWEYRWVE